MENATRALVPVGKYALMQGDTQKFTRALMRNIGPQGLSEFDLDRITVPTGAVTIWELPSVDGPQHKEAFEGIILAFKDTRRFWEVSFEESGGGSPPDCSSDDGLSGQGNPGGCCKTCPHAQWESDPKGGPGQACKAVRVLFVTLPEEKMPYVVPLPATSLKPGRQYFMRLVSRGLPFFSVVTRFGLAPAQNKAGIKHSVVTLDRTGHLSEKEVVAIQRIADALAPVFETFKATNDDFMDGSDGSDVPEPQVENEIAQDEPGEEEPPQEEPPQEDSNDTVALAVAQAEAAEAEAEAVEAAAKVANAKAKAAKAKAQALSAKAEAERTKGKGRKKASKKAKKKS